MANISSVDPTSLIEKGNQMIASAFPKGKELSDGDILNGCCAKNLGSQMVIAGQAMQEGRLSSLLSLCDQHLEDPSTGISKNVLKPSYEFIISKSDDQSLVDRALSCLATLHLKGLLFEKMSVEERYKLPEAETVAIADLLTQSIVDDKLYDRWTDQIRTPYMNRRQNRRQIRRR
jgi:hypothetical protein